MREVFARTCSIKKTFLKITQNSQKNTLLDSLSKTIKGFHAVRLATLLKTNPRTGLLESAVCKCSLK